jgi:hypothetical protein
MAYGLVNTVRLSVFSLRALCGLGQLSPQLHYALFLHRLQCLRPFFERNSPPLKTKVLIPLGPATGLGTALILSWPWGVVFFTEQCHNAFSSTLEFYLLETASI